MLSVGIQSMGFCLISRDVFIRYCKDEIFIPSDITGVGRINSVRVYAHMIITPGIAFRD